MATHRAHHLVGLAVSLEREWQHLAGSPQLRAALAGWARQYPVLGGYGDGEQLRAAVHDRGQVDRADRILSALVVEAATDGGDDPLAARVVLQLLLPGVVALQRRLSHLITNDTDDHDAQVLLAVMETIRGYPWRRRPARIAANILLDTHMRVRRQRRPVLESPVESIEDKPAPAGDDGFRVELLELFVWAVTEGVVSADEVLLIARTQLDQESVAAVADELGVAHPTLLRRRQRALANLTAALPAYATAVA